MGNFKTINILNLSRYLNFWLYFLITALLSGFFVYLNLSEFIQVEILNKIEGYPFGGEGPTPWYYKTKELYSTVTFFFSLLFLTAFIFALWAFMRDKKAWLIITFMLTFFMVIIQLLSGQSS